MEWCARPPCAPLPPPIPHRPPRALSSLLPVQACSSARWSRRPPAAGWSAEPLPGGWLRLVELGESVVLDLWIRIAARRRERGGHSCSLQILCASYRRSTRAAAGACQRDRAATGVPVTNSFQFLSVDLFENNAILECFSFEESTVSERSGFKRRMKKKQKEKEREGGREKTRSAGRGLFQEQEAHVGGLGRGLEDTDCVRMGQEFFSATVQQAARNRINGLVDPAPSSQAARQAPAQCTYAPSPVDDTRLLSCVLHVCAPPGRRRVHSWTESHLLQIRSPAGPLPNLHGAGRGAAGASRSFGSAGARAPALHACMQGRRHVSPASTWWAADTPHGHPAGRPLRRRAPRARAVNEAALSSHRRPREGPGRPRRD
jgi:hypothetical protein